MTDLESDLRTAIKSALLAIVWLLFGRFFVVARVRGASMMPTLIDDDLVLGIRIPYFVTRLRFSIRNNVLKRGTIVLVHPFGRENSMHIKRIVAVEGDMYKSAHGVQEIPSGHIFVIGDHALLTSLKEPGIDSRSYGPIPMAAIAGVVVMQVNRGYAVLKGSDKQGR